MTSVKSSLLERRRSQRAGSVLVTNQNDNSVFDSLRMSGGMVDFGENPQWVLSKDQINDVQSSKMAPIRQVCRSISKSPEIISDLINTLASQKQKIIATKEHETMLNTFEVIFLEQAGIIVQKPDQNDNIQRSRSVGSGSEFLEAFRMETRMIHWQSIKDIEKKITTPNLINNFNDKYQENIDTVKRRQNFGKLNIAESIIKFTQDALAERQRLDKIVNKGIKETSTPSQHYSAAKDSQISELDAQLSNDFDSMFGNLDYSIALPCGLPQGESNSPLQLQDSPQPLPDHRDEPKPWSMLVQKALGPEIDPAQEFKFQIKSKSPPKRFIPSPDEPSTPETPNLKISIPDLISFGAHLPDLEVPPKPIGKNPNLDSGLESSRVRPNLLNESRDLNPFVLRISPFKDRGLDQKFFSKNDNKKSPIINRSMAPNPGNATTRNKNSPGHLNFGGKDPSAYLRKNSQPPKIAEIGSSDKPPFDLNFDFLRVTEQFLKNHDVFFSSLNKDNTNFLLEFAKQEKARIFNLCMVLDKFIEKGKVSNIMKTPNVSLPFYQRQILLEQHRPALFQVTSKLLEQYNDISHTFTTESCTASPSGYQIEPLIRKSETKALGELNC